MTTDGLKFFSLLPEAPLRPVAFAASATWLIRHWMEGAPLTHGYSVESESTSQTTSWSVQPVQHSSRLWPIDTSRPRRSLCRRGGLITALQISFHCIRRRQCRNFTARRSARAAYAVASVCPSVSVCRNSEFYESGWAYRAGFGHGSFISPVLHCHKDIRVSPKQGYSSCLWNFVPNSGFRKISQRQVDRVVNKTRRQSSLLTTLAAVDASWLDARSLLHVRRL